MSTRRKLLLAIIILIVVAAHVALFAAGGQWRRLGIALILVDVFSAWFVFAIRETRKLDKHPNP